ncbi:MAG: M28 family peptidase, partial [Planctomycetota bacterium]
MIENPRQLTFEGRRAGEGYFSRDGTAMVFQSEREPGNPFYQIYLMDLETGDTRRMSPGAGKTTCAWIHPAGDRVLFASTHLDPDALAKQRAELEERASGKGRRYAWSFDPYYDIFEVEVGGGPLRNLTDTMGYDAEGSWSPDGGYILFASNRHAYSEPLGDEERAILERDPSYFMELYIMRSDGSGVRRLTDVPGYDGGPFFSHDGSKIVWRRFAPDGGSAEIYTMSRDGTGEKAITSLGALSWAPFFHPSGDYVIFTTSVHGFANFELYMVDAEGRSAPVRVTDSDGFDGLPVFSPDGKRLSWSTSRGADKTPQIFLAGWNDAAARRLLGLDATAVEGPGEAAAPALPATKAAIDAADLRGHVEVLASADMEGRLTGSPGERRAARYLAEAFRAIGLDPAGDDGTYFQGFEFTASVSLGPGNRLSFEGLDRTAELDRDWRPLGFSASGPAGPAEVVFAGYGIVAPGADDNAAYDSYGDLDVTDKWVLVLRYLPEDVTPEQRQHLYRYAELNYKAAVARARGALGLIVASGPTAAVKDQLVPLTFEAAGAGGDLAALSISDDLAEAMFAPAGKTLRGVQETLDAGEAVPRFALPGVRVSATVDVVEETGVARNVLGRVPAG